MAHGKWKNYKVVLNKFDGEKVMPRFHFVFYISLTVEQDIHDNYTHNIYSRYDNPAFIYNKIYMFDGKIF